MCNVAVGQTFMGAVQQYGLGPVYCFFGAMALAGALYVSSQVRQAGQRRSRELVGVWCALPLRHSTLAG